MRGVSTQLFKLALPVGAEAAAEAAGGNAGGNAGAGAAGEI